jgi:2-oxoglutarate ferredoxin oxidoreductase subunit alpha
MANAIEKRKEVVIKFAGDSGDGMQLTGGQFTSNTALIGNDLATFPDFPAEIRAPAGTLAGVSGFQIHFASREVYTPGDECDVLVAMNSAALKANLKSLSKTGIIIVNTDGFDSKNLRLAGYEENPLEDGSLESWHVYRIDVTRLTRECLKESSMGMKEKDRSKNMFVLGFIYWMFGRSLDSTIKFLEKKFASKPELIEANVKVLKAGYHYGDTTETFSTQFKVEPAELSPGNYRSIMGNEATGMGLIAASVKSGLPLFLGSYPITPASDILHYLARHKNFGIRTFQAEDEIAAVCAAIGASFGGHLALTSTSGPGIALKGEAMGLAGILEIPLVICNIQRAGPSTGMPTKTEQSDLMQVYYGRNGESPMPIVAPSKPSDAFEMAYMACKIAVEHMTPVIFLSDGYIANGSEPWKYPNSEDLPEIKYAFAPPREKEDEAFLPYQRDERLVRPWAIPGTKGLEHRIGGLEKEDLTGNVSYDPDNHEYMVKVRQEKVDRIADFIPEQEVDSGPDQGDLLILAWGSTFGACKAATRELLDGGHSVAHAHIRYLNPFPKNLEEFMGRYKRVMVPEINNGQLINLLKAKYLIDAIPFNKIQGVPIQRRELVEKAKEVLASI